MVEMLNVTGIDYAGLGAPPPPAALCRFTLATHFICEDSQGACRRGETHLLNANECRIRVWFSLPKILSAMRHFMFEGVCVDVDVWTGRVYICTSRYKFKREEKRDRGSGVSVCLSVRLSVCPSVRTYRPISD